MTSGSPTTATTTDTLWDAAERLRNVRRAHARFLALWAVDRLFDAPAATARAWADIDAAVDADRDPVATPDNHGIPDELQRRSSRDRVMDD